MKTLLLAMLLLSGCAALKGYKASDNWLHIEAPPVDKTSLPIRCNSNSVGGMTYTNCYQ